MAVGRGRATLALGMLLAAVSATAMDWTDTFVGYRYEPRSREPNNAHEIEKNIIQLTHASGYRYGSNFLNIDLFQSDRHDPAQASTDGAREVYLTYRHQLEWGKIAGQPMSFGAVKDVALTAGADLNTKNTAFAPRKRAVVLGPTLKIDVPGFLDVGLWYYREANHSAFGSAHKDLVFDGSWLLNAAWGIPFDAGPVPAKFQGFANLVGDKGKDYSNRNTEREILLRTSVMFDLGTRLSLGRNALWLGLGYEYWHNKFGNPPGVGTRVSSPQLQAEWHF